LESVPACATEVGMFLDPDGREVRSKVTLRGDPGAVLAFVTAVAAAIGVGEDPASEGEGEMLILPLKMGVIDGAEFELHLYAALSPFPGWRMLILRRADAVIELFDGVAPEARAERIRVLATELEEQGYAPAKFPRFAVSNEPVDGFDVTSPAEGPLVVMQKVGKRVVQEFRAYRARA
jgi:hypothetical protein